MLLRIIEALGLVLLATFIGSIIGILACGLWGLCSWIAYVAGDPFPGEDIREVFVRLLLLLLLVAVILLGGW